jgi:hypothetical protein
VNEEPRLVASPLSLAGEALAAIGWRGRSRLLVFAGGLAIGGGLKLVPSPS